MKDTYENHKCDNCNNIKVMRVYDGDSFIRLCDDCRDVNYQHLIEKVAGDLYKTAHYCDFDDQIIESFAPIITTLTNQILEAEAQRVEGEAHKWERRPAWKEHYRAGYNQALTDTATDIRSRKV